MPFDEKAVVLGLPPEELRDCMHGEINPDRLEARLQQAIKVLRNVRAVLKSEGIPIWLRTPIPAFGGLAPLDVFRDGDVEDLVARTGSYRDAPFT